MSYDIAYIVSHGFAARMVTQTDLLGKLVQLGKKVALICPDKHDANLRAYCDQKGVDLFEFNDAGKLSHQQYIFKRKYYLEDLEKNPALWEKHIHATRYNKSRNPLTHIWPRYYVIIYRLIKHFPKIRERFQKQEKKHLHSAKAQKLISQLQPKKLIATYPVNFNEAALLYYGNKAEEVETWIHLLSWDNITCKGHFPELANKYIAWGNVMKSEFQEYYNIPESSIHVCGVPHFDLHASVKTNSCFKPYVAELGLNAELPYLFFAMSSPRFAPNEIDIVEWLGKSVENGVFGKDMQLIVRPHPQNVEGGMADKSWLPRLKSLGEKKQVAIDMPDLVKSKLGWSMDQKDMVRMSSLLAGANITFNSGSTMSIDALIHHKPVIITSFDADEKLNYWKSARRLIDYLHLKKLVGLGGVQVVRSFDELEKVILRYLENPELNMEKRLKTLEMECRTIGQSTEAITNLLSL